jgi:pyruvate formate lyase activating enzyme
VETRQEQYAATSYFCNSRWRSLLISENKRCFLISPALHLFRQIVEKFRGAPFAIPSKAKTLPQRRGSMKEALFSQAMEDQSVVCNLCAHRCLIRPGRSGICGVRENRDGVLYTLVYDRVIAAHVDPIEKKPFFHFLPGSSSFSIATVGCNFHCLFCQNWEMSQMPKDRRGVILGKKFSPEQIVRQARAQRCATIAYTYTEPTIFFELAYDTAKLATAEGLQNLFVTNGYMTPEALTMIQPYLHAANVDLKGFNEARHRRVCGAKLQPVLDTIRLLKERHIWLEVTTLLIPGHNDSDEELQQIARFLKSVGEDIPWHVSAFHPAYKMQEVEPTDLADLQRAWRIGKEEGLRYVYCGNLPEAHHEDTVCYRCGTQLVERRWFDVRRMTLQQGRCPKCDAPIDGVWGGM